MRERGREGERERLVSKLPLLREAGHVDEFTDDVVVGLMQFVKIFLAYVAALGSKFEPSLGFCCFAFGVGEFGDKRFGILSLSKSLGNITTN